MEAIEIPITSRPAELLAWDDAFLEETEETGRRFLWFWESPAPFVVVGYGGRIDETVERDLCLREGIPILRRRSGGGTVLQGPGCLTYGITLPIDSNTALARVDWTNRWILERLAQALQEAGRHSVCIDGHTDLTLEMPDGKRKFSGNAQRRTRNSVLFHGTFLHGANLDAIGRFLKMPADRPIYRGSRSHADFLTHLPLQPAEIRRAITGAWNATPSAAALPRARHQEALDARYGHECWHVERTEQRRGRGAGTDLPTR